MEEPTGSSRGLDSRVEGDATGVGGMGKRSGNLKGLQPLPSILLVKNIPSSAYMLAVGCVSYYNQFGDQFGNHLKKWKMQMVCNSEIVLGGGC